MKKSLTLRNVWRFWSLVVLFGLAVTLIGSSATAQTTTVVTVPSNPLWTDTGIALTAGQNVTISATGSWNWGQARSNFGPDGDPNFFSGSGDEFEFFDVVDHGRLLGFVGSDPYQGQGGNGSFYPQTSGYISVGSGQSFAAHYAGELWLGFNDDAVSGATGDNSGQVSATITVGGSDVTAPAIAIAVPTTVYTQNQKVSAKYSCADPDDVVASCAGPVANGAHVDTSSGGPHAFTVVAADSHGTSSSKTAVYMVANVGLAPQSFAYSPQFVGTTSAAQRVMLFNRQSVPLNISGISTNGSFAETPTCGAVLAAHASCSISVTFKPTAAGDSQGSLNVSDDAGTQSIVLVGFGTLVKLSPPKVAFANQTVGTTSLAKNVTLKNAQTVTLNVSSINMTGDFALAPLTTCPSNGAVLAGKSCIIAITFTPTVAGARTGTLIVQADYPTAPVAVQLSGTGTP